MCAASCAAITPVSAKIAPTERSNPPAMSTSVPPQAMIPHSEFWSSTLNRFTFVRNTLLLNVRKTKMTMKLATMP